MRVIICGGRDFKDFDKGKAILDLLLGPYTSYKDGVFPTLTVIEGGAKGADTMADEWLSDNRYSRHIKRKADWEKHGRAAGAIRNREMLGDDPDLIIAFPGGLGTENMIKQAKKAGVPVLRVEI